jgi:hypothetical protein
MEEPKWSQPVTEPISPEYNSENMDLVTQGNTMQKHDYETMDPTLYTLLVARSGKRICT